MTHEELLYEELRAKIDEHIDYGTCGVCDGECYKVENMPWLALRAVVELLKEFSEDEMLEQYKNSYLLLAFQEAIEKELK